jgi:hypothetical protein
MSFPLPKLRLPTAGVANPVLPATIFGPELPDGVTSRKVAAACGDLCTQLVRASAPASTRISRRSPGVNRTNGKLA